MSKWRRATLEELAHFQRGFDISKAEQQPGNIPVVSSSGVTSYHSVAKVKGPGVTIGRKGTLGTVFYVPQDYWPHSTSLWVTDFNGNEPKFVYYFLKTLGLEQYDVGASNPTLNRNHIHGLQIAIPDVKTQRRIADILSAYDDLIENNRRRIAILEETARLTYRKWFGGHNISADGAARSRHEVRKRGRGSVRAKTTTLEDVAEVLYGRDHKKIPDGTIPIFGSGGVMRYGTAAIFDKPSVLIPRKGTIGNVMYVDEPFWTVDTMFYTRFKLPNMEKILYYQLCDYNLASMSTGAAVPSMTTAILNSLEIEVPPDDLRVKFDMAVEPMFAQKRLLKKQNAALATARDMLLPRLMKGAVVS